MAKPMSQQVQPKQVLTQRQDAKAVVSDPAFEQRMSVVEQGNAAVIDWFDAAVGAYPKAAAMAAEMGCTEAYLSQMRHGERSIPLRAILPLLQNQDSATVLLTALCEAAGFAPPQRPRKASKRQVQAATTMKVRQVAQLWLLVRGEVAAELKTSVTDVEQALDEAEEAVSK